MIYTSLCQLSMVIWGMVYYCYTHINFHVVVRHRATGSALFAALDGQVLAAAAADTDICELRQAPESSAPARSSTVGHILAQQTQLRAVALSLDITRPSGCGLCHFPQLEIG